MPVEHLRRWSDINPPLVHTMFDQCCDGGPALIKHCLVYRVGCPPRENGHLRYIVRKSGASVAKCTLHGHHLDGADEVGPNEGCKQPAYVSTEVMPCCPAAEFCCLVTDAVGDVWKEKTCSILLLHRRWTPGRRLGCAFRQEGAPRRT